MRLIVLFSFFWANIPLIAQVADNLYIVADKADSPFPDSPVAYYLDGKLVDVCFRNRLMTILNPLCLNTNGEVLEINDSIDDFDGEVWDHEDLNSYAKENFELRTDNCDDLLESYENIYVALKKEEAIIYIKYKSVLAIK